MIRSVTLVAYAPFFAACVLLLGPEPARACGNAVHYEAHEEMRDVQRAERMLAAGKLRKASAVARAVLLSLRETGRPSPTRRTLAERAEVVHAVAAVRIAIGHPEKKRASRLRRALRTLARVHEADRTPLHEAYYAEALSAFPDKTREAFQILVALHRRDLMPSAWAYRVLFRLAEEHGDAQLRTTAHARCRAMAAHRADAICTAVARS